MRCTGSLEEQNAALLAAMKETLNPGVRSLKLSAYLRDAREDGLISLYEHYLLQGECQTPEYQFHHLPAWNRKTGILDLLPLLNLRMMALLYRDPQAAGLWESWAMELYRLNQERRHRQKR